MGFLSALRRWRASQRGPIDPQVDLERWFRQQAAGLEEIRAAAAAIVAARTRLEMTILAETAREVQGGPSDHLAELREQVEELIGQEMDVKVEAARLERELGTARAMSEVTRARIASARARSHVSRVAGELDLEREYSLALRRAQEAADSATAMAAAADEVYGKDTGGPDGPALPDRSE
jgi:phage shock protein A